MNPLRLIRDDWPLAVLAAVLLLCGLLLAVAAWARRRERRGDWGPGLVGIRTDLDGYSPADMRATVNRTPVDDPQERWLLGLAAPFVEPVGLLHDRWSLVPAFCSDAWKRHLAVVAERWGVTRADAWKRETARAEQHLADAADPLAVWTLSSFAMLLRLGVALRHTSGTRARERLRVAAAPLRERHSDWLGFADDWIAAAEIARPGRTAELRADVRTLFAEDGPWHDPGWP
ncbi:hypothetical protein WDU99_02195 [Microbacterium sp. Mu-80]|uniref:DUF1266 domain-containing protein n=1 Tax=Microbacterium bandirmense TaxID=3122050 RepID=A0ABU8L8S4_9MICO